MKVDSDGRVAMQICAGINGLGDLQPPDSRLAEAGFDVVFGNWEAISVAMREAKAAAGSAMCGALAAQDRVVCVRRHLADVLPTNREFSAALLPAIRDLQEIGLVCSDCS
jgi:hypothetical protein